MVEHSVYYLQQDGDSELLESQLLEVRNKRRGSRGANPSISHVAPVTLVLCRPDINGEQTTILFPSGYRVAARTAREIGVVGESSDVTIWLTFDVSKGRPRMINMTQTPAQGVAENSKAKRRTVSGRVPTRPMSAHR